MLSDGASSARAATSRANGAKSKGPRTAEGKARSSQNALRHGLCAKKFLLLPDDSRAQFEALEAALLDDLAPEGALQILLAHRLIAAAWRLQRADRLELELLRAPDALHADGGPLRHWSVARTLPTLVRYRNASQSEFFRALKALEAIQRKAAALADEAALGEEAVVLELARKRVTLSTQSDSSGSEASPNEPERPPSGQENDAEATPNEPEPPAQDQGDVAQVRSEGMVRPAGSGMEHDEAEDPSGGPVCASDGPGDRPERLETSRFAILTAGPAGPEKMPADIHPPAVLLD
jgi:hypothetical protein